MFSLCVVYSILWGSIVFYRGSIVFYRGSIVFYRGSIVFYGVYVVIHRDLYGDLELISFLSDG